jgi:flagellar biosynthetic protein FliR
MDLRVPSPELIGTFLLAFVRVSGLLFATPVLGNRNVPPQVRILLSLLFTMAILPLVPVSRIAPEADGFVPAMVAEVILGGFLGLIGSLLFAAAEFGGHMAGLQMGFSIASILNPESESQTSVFATLTSLTALLTFVMSDGHHLFVTALVRSFQSLPLGTFAIDAARAGTLMRMTTGIFAYGLALAAPVLAITLFITVALGILSRSMPQIDVFFMSFAINISVGIFIFILSIPFFLAGIQKLIGITERELLFVLDVAR